MGKNEDSIKNKLLRNVEETNKVQKKRGRSRKIIQEVKLHEPIKKRGRPRKVINKSPENYKKRKFMESEDKFDSDSDHDVEQKRKANKKKKHFRKIKKKLILNKIRTYQVKMKNQKKLRKISRTKKMKVRMGSWIN